jgi:hypothetical protein
MKKIISLASLLLLVVSAQAYACADAAGTWQEVPGSTNWQYVLTQDGSGNVNGNLTAPKPGGGSCTVPVSGYYDYTYDEFHLTYGSGGSLCGYAAGNFTAIVSTDSAGGYYSCMKFYDRLEPFGADRFLSQQYGEPTYLCFPGE